MRCHLHYSHDMQPKLGPIGEAPSENPDMECFKCWTCTCHGAPELEQACVPVVIPPRNNIARQLVAN